MKKTNTGVPTTIVLLIISCSFLFYAFSTGITGMTQLNGAGCNCHGNDPTAGVMVLINGPDSVVQSQSAQFTVTITGGPLVRGGTNIAVSAGTLLPAGSDLQVIGGELTHTAPKAPASGVVTFQFQYTAPAMLGNQTIYANGNSVNFDSNPTGDNWNFAVSKQIIVVEEIPVELTSFTASVTGNNVLLNWSTATETNNSHFDIFRSSVADQWVYVSTINGSGTSTQTNNYSYMDEQLQPGNYFYKIKQVDFNGSSEEYYLQNEIAIGSPAEFTLSQNYPNPFNPSTKIDYSIKQPGYVKLVVYNAIGKETALLYNGYKEEGFYSEIFDASGLPSGIYYFQLIINNFFDGEEMYNKVNKMLLLK
jgi:hypothetical protein